MKYAKLISTLCGVTLCTTLQAQSPSCNYVMACEELDTTGTNCHVRLHFNSLVQNKTITYGYNADGTKTSAEYVVSSPKRPGNHSTSTGIIGSIGNTGTKTTFIDGFPTVSLPSTGLEYLLSMNRTDYCGNIVYENDTLKRVLIDGGYITFAHTKGGSLSAPQYHFYVKDHLGNNRIVANGSGKIEETNNYYPYGGLMADNTTVKSVQPYKYVGKEFDGMFGWNMLDHGARWYDAAIGRWWNMDSMAEKYCWISPYISCADNPLIYIDDNGKETKVGIEITKLGHTFLVVQNESLIVYTYGRFLEGDKHKNHFSFTDPTGPGVLLRLEGNEALAYVNKETYKYEANYYIVKDVNDSKIQNYMDTQFYKGRELSQHERKIMISKGLNPKSARVIDKYNLIDNNCTTKSIDALRHGGTKLKFSIQKIKFTDGKNLPVIKTEPIFTPRKLKEYFEENKK